MNAYIPVVIALFSGTLLGICITALCRKDGRDSDRLDFISSTTCEIVFEPVKGVWGVVDVRKRVSTATSLRAAIDKAEAQGMGDYA